MSSATVEFEVDDDDDFTLLDALQAAPVHVDPSSAVTAAALVNPTATTGKPSGQTTTNNSNSARSGLSAIDANQQRQTLQQKQRQQQQQYEVKKPTGGGIFKYNNSAGIKPPARSTAAAAASSTQQQTPASSSSSFKLHSSSSAAAASSAHNTAATIGVGGGGGGFATAHSNLQAKASSLNSAEGSNTIFVENKSGIRISYPTPIVLPEERSDSLSATPESPPATQQRQDSLLSRLLAQYTYVNIHDASSRHSNSVPVVSTSNRLAAADDCSWCSVAVVVQRGEPKLSATGRGAHGIIRVWDMFATKAATATTGPSSSSSTKAGSGGSPHSTILVCGNAFDTHFTRLMSGDVFLFLFPDSRNTASSSTASSSSAASTSFSLLKISDERHMRHLGRAKDLQRCASTTRLGEQCVNFVNAAKISFCQYHMLSALNSLKSSKPQQTQQQQQTPRALAVPSQATRQQPPPPRPAGLTANNISHQSANNNNNNNKSATKRHIVLGGGSSMMHIGGTSSQQQQRQETAGTNTSLNPYSHVSVSLHKPLQTQSLSAQQPLAMRNAPPSSTTSLSTQQQQQTPAATKNTRGAHMLNAAIHTAKSTNEKKDLDTALGITQLASSNAVVATTASYADPRQKRERSPPATTTNQANTSNKERRKGNNNTSGSGPIPVVMIKNPLHEDSAANRVPAKPPLFAPLPSSLRAENSRVVLPSTASPGTTGTTPTTRIGLTGSSTKLSQLLMQSAADSSSAAQPQQRQETSSSSLVHEAENLQSLHERTLITQDRRRRDDAKFERYEAADRIYNALEEMHEVDVKGWFCHDCTHWYFSKPRPCTQKEHRIEYRDTEKRFYRCSECGYGTVALGRLPPYHMECGRCRKKDTWERCSAGKAQVRSFKGL